MSDIPRTPYRFPLSAKAQAFFVRLGGERYYVTIRFNSEGQCWMMSLADAGKVRIVDNIPVVTGLDLLAPFRYAGIPGSIVVQTDHDADAVPTYANLGGDGNIYYVTVT